MMVWARMALPAGLVTAAVAYLALHARALWFVIKLGFKANAVRGKYMATAAGCVSCHAPSSQGDVRLAGGIALKTPFGDINSKNISFDTTKGIGEWSDQEFLNAARRGVSTRGRRYSPAFSYELYAGLSNADVLDIRAYFLTLLSSAFDPKPTTRPFPFNIRHGIGLCKAVSAPEPLRRDAAPVSQSPFERVQYFVEHAAHCAKRHTPRTALLGLDDTRAFTGPSGFDGLVAPAWTPEQLKAAASEAFDTTPRFGRKRERLRLDHGPDHDRSRDEFEPPQRGRSQGDLPLPYGARPRKARRNESISDFVGDRRAIRREPNPHRPPHARTKQENARHV